MRNWESIVTLVESITTAEEDWGEWFECSPQGEGAQKPKRMDMSGTEDQVGRIKGGEEATIVRLEGEGKK